MELKDYFENTAGTGILATANSEGKVNTALYARPHFMDDGTIAFIMNDRLSHANLLSNPHAAYMFIESGPGKHGKRLYLKKVREEENSELIEKLRRRYSGSEDHGDRKKFLVYFEVEKELPLVGSGS
ncbi:MAG TPA: pyridoxamine 5'-phosphate oxidase family protein [Spirochaetota bacterium]|nr:pyridoxamine 5'-phosphate oxidase family protein [Spirochaetota bacterium]HPJ38267.1 pyridoxamine 5'-phosphate oxidase family protein [Spirochaetota bacterium]HPQ55485.1 pyridoxamine 5'-phosphate oxidase family protein [Spirochaetota bacterium]